MNFLRRLFSPAPRPDADGVYPPMLEGDGRDVYPFDLVAVPLKTGGEIYYLWVDGENVAHWVRPPSAEIAMAKAREYVRAHYKMETG